jgi:hypothetical protein
MKTLRRWKRQIKKTCPHFAIFATRFKNMYLMTTYPKNMSLLLQFVDMSIKNNKINQLNSMIGVLIPKVENGVSG